MERLLLDVHNNPDIRDLYTELVDLIWVKRGSARTPEAQELLEEIRSLTGVTKSDILSLVKRDPAKSKYVEEKERPEITNSRHASLKDIEAELEQLGYEYSVRPGSGITGTIYFVYKNQKDHSEEQQELKDLAERNHGNFDNPVKSSSYRIYVVSLEHNR
jgi:hypothetical protein